MRVEVKGEEELDRLFDGIMLTVADPEGERRVPGWCCRACGWRVGALNLPPSHECPGDGNEQWIRVNYPAIGSLLLGSVDPEAARQLRKLVGVYVRLSRELRKLPGAEGVARYVELVKENEELRASTNAHLCAAVANEQERAAKRAEALQSKMPDVTDYADGWKAACRACGAEIRRPTL